MQAELRWLKARVAALESASAVAHACRPRRRQRNPHYTDIEPEEHLRRVTLWSHWQLLRRNRVAGKTFNRRRGEAAPWSVEAFSVEIRDADGRRFPVREIWRWLSDRSTHRTGGPWDRRITAAIQAAIAGMIADGFTLSPGMQ